MKQLISQLSETSPMLFTLLFCLTILAIFIAPVVKPTPPMPTPDDSYKIKLEDLEIVIDGVNTRLTKLEKQQKKLTRITFQHKYFRI